jgi:T5SS/PEP-CTERM-associated repeat protein
MDEFEYSQKVTIDNFAENSFLPAPTPQHPTPEPTPELIPASQNTLPTAMKTRLRTPMLRPLAIVLAAASVLGSARAADWEFATGDWALAANWNPDGVPNGVAANISNAGTATISTAITDVPTVITIGSGAGNSGTVSVEASGNIAVALGGATTVGKNGGTGTLNISGGGSITTGTLGVGGDAPGGIPSAGQGAMTINTSGTVASDDVGVGVGAGGNGNVTMAAGTWNITAGAGGGFGIGVAGGSGIVTLSGGNVNVLGATAVGFQGGTGALNVLGTAGMATGFLYVGDVGGTGVGNMTINTTGAVVSTDATIGNGGTGTVKVESGLWSMNNLTIQDGGSGTVNVIGGDLVAGGTVNVGQTGGVTPGSLNIADTAGVGGLFTGYGLGAGNANTGVEVNVKNSGVLAINTTGVVTSATANIANGSAGSALVDSGTWNATALNIGIAGGAGNLLQSGGSISVTNGTGDAQLRVGDGAGATGLIDLQGTASLTANIFEIGVNGGSATLNIGPGSTLTALSWINFGSGDANSNINQTGGVLNIGSWGALGLGGGVTTPLYEMSGGEIIGGGLEVASDRTASMEVTGTAFIHPTSVEVATRDSNGTMNINSANAVVQPLDFKIGSRTVNAVGLVTLADGQLIPTNNLVVADLGKGTLNQNGGNVATNVLNVAANAGGVGVYNFNAGTSVVNEIYLGNGVGAHGTINIAAGQEFVQNGWAEVGRNGGTGVINVDGAGAKFTHAPTAGDFQLGYNGGIGELNVKNGGTFTHSWWINVARGAGSVGNILVDGPGSMIENSIQDVRTNIGENGTGTLTVSNGGVFKARELFVAREAGSVGTINILSGGVVSTDQWLEIGSRTGVGVVNIDGAGSKMSHFGLISGRNGGGGGDTQVGLDGGNGTINLTNGGQFETGWWLNVARGVGSVGTINADNGSQIRVGATNLDAKVNIGEQGVGTVTLTNGSQLVVSNPGIGGAELYVGRDPGSTGVLNVASGSEVQANGSWAMIVGQQGTGTVNVTDGGKVLSNNWLVVGNEPGSVGTISIDDPASIIESGTPLDNGVNEGRFITGRLGVATVNQANGTVRADNWFAIGIDPGGTGTYNMSGGKIELYQPNFGDRNIIVANAGTGTMNITNATPAGDTIVGGTADAQYGTSINQFNVGADRGVGTLTIDVGVGNKISHRELYAGWNAGANGTINISSGILETTGWVEIGRGQNGQGGTGTVNVSGPDAIWERGTTGPLLPEGNARDMNFGQGEADNTGKGYLNVTNGGTVNTNWWINLARNRFTEGHILVDGPGSTVNMVDAHLVGRGGDGNSQLNVGESGIGSLTVSGGGVFNHNMDNGGGEVWISRNGGSTGTMTVTGAGSAFNSKGREFRVANDTGGGGTLNITDGGVLNFNSTNEAGAQVTGNFGIAENNAAVGTINMDNGTLNITAWSMFSAWQDNAAASVATINATNSAINLLPGPDHGRLLWGRRGEATINQSGGTFLVSNWAVLGVEAGGRGRLNMTDGAQAQFNNELNVGRAGGIGSVTLDTGSVINVAGEVFVGRDGAGSNGSFTVTGGSTANLANNLAIGQGGGGSTGLVEISGAGTTMNVNGWTTLGRDTGGVAQSSTLNVTDGAVFNHLTLNSGDMLVGWQAGSTGVINVTNGGKINQSWWTRFGIDPGSVGTATVDGVGSEFNVTGGRVYVGERALGTLNITNGGKFSHTNVDQFNVGGSDGGGTGEGDGTVTVDGAGSLLTSSNFIRVGHGNDPGTLDPAQGTLNVNGGDVVLGGWLGIGHEGGDGYLNMTGGSITTGTDVNLDRNFYVGVDDNGHARHPTGTANISGGTINVGNEFIVGRAGGIGTYTQTGGTLNVNGWVRIGQNTGGIGTVTIDGVGSQANFLANGDANVGIDGGVGALNVTNGGTVVANQWLNIARAPGSTGTVTVDGPGSTLTTGGPFQGFLNVGEDGSGTLNITNGGVVTHLAGTGSDRYMDVGRNAGAVGTVNVDGANSELIANNWLRIGGENVTSKGSVTVNDGKLTVGGQLRVGNHGEGTLTLLGNAEATLGFGAQNHYVGTHNFPNLGTFTIADNALVKTGAGSYMEVGWASNTEEKVGNGVLVQTGGLITSVTDPTGSGAAPAGDYLGLEFARGVGSFGTHTMDGGTAFLRSYMVGHQGTGTATINGGTLNIRNGGEFNVGFDGPGNGTFNLNDGTVNVVTDSVGGNVTIVGRAAVGVMNMAGGQFTTHSWMFAIGNDGTGDGTLNMSGGTITIPDYDPAVLGTDNGDLLVGRFGKGVINQTGGTINAHGWTIIGVDPSGNGAWNASGTAVINSFDEDFIVGRQSTVPAILTLTDDAQFNRGSALGALNLNVGTEGAAGIINQDGNATINSAGHDTRLILGAGGASSGTYNLSGGGAKFGALIIANTPSNTGVLNMAGGSLTVANNLEVGSSGGAATLNHTGGTLSAGEINIGDGAASVPSAAMQGGLHIGATPFSNQANARTAVRVRGGTLDVNGDVTLDTGTTLEVSGPTIEVNNGGGVGNAVDGAMRVTGSNFHVSGTATVDGGVGTLNVLSATLSGTGAINAKTNVLGATLAPGNSPGILTLNGDVTLDAASTFAAEIESLASYDAITVNGALTLGGAYLQGSTVGVLNIVAGDLYFIGRNDGVDPVTGTFSFTLGGAPIPDGATVAFGPASFTISYDADFAGNTLNGGNDIALEAQTTIPEPGSALLLGLGALVLARRRRKTA